MTTIDDDDDDDDDETRERQMRLTYLRVNLSRVTVATR